MTKKELEKQIKHLKREFLTLRNRILDLNKEAVDKKREITKLILEKNVLKKKNDIMNDAIIQKFIKEVQEKGSTWTVTGQSNMTAGE